MERVRFGPPEEPDRRDVQVRCPLLEQVVPWEHAVSEPQPPNFEQSSLLDL